MKYLFILLLTLSFQLSNAQNLSFSNASLKSYLLTENSIDLNDDEFADTTIDLNGDNEIQLSEALLVENLVIGLNRETFNITSIQDIHQFSNLKKLTLWGDFGLTEISNLSLNSLQHIRVSDHNSIIDIDLSDLPNLKSIYLEGLTGLQNLNLQNGSYASDAFSLFYTYVEYACVDSISLEYNTVAQHLIAGGSISMKCAVGIAENDSALEVYPNPSSNILNFSQEFESAEIYDLSGKLIKLWSVPKDKISISHLDSGLYLLRIKLKNKTIIERKFIKY